MFGAGSQINVGGLVASTLNLSNEDFLAGRMRFTGSSLANSGNSLINSGNITTTGGGNVYMIGSAVTNNGIITSPKGEVILAAGNSVELVNPGTPDLRVEIVAPDNQALNLGTIAAESGRIGIYAGLINQSGNINANSVVVGENGQITLKATKNATLEAGSSTTANGPSGGAITVQSGDTTMVSGTVEAKGFLPLPPGQGNTWSGAEGWGEGGVEYKPRHLIIQLLELLMAQRGRGDVDEVALSGMTVLPIHRVGRRVGEAFQLAQGLGQHRGVVIAVDDPVAPLVLFQQRGGETVVTEAAAAFPAHGVGDAAVVFPIDDFFQARKDVRVAVLAQLDHDPAAAHIVGHRRWGSLTRPQVEEFEVAAGGR